MNRARAHCMAILSLMAAWLGADEPPASVSNLSFATIHLHGQAPSEACFAPILRTIQVTSRLAPSSRYVQKLTDKSICMAQGSPTVQQDDRDVSK